MEDDIFDCLKPILVQQSPFLARRSNVLEQSNEEVDVGACKLLQEPAQHRFASYRVFMT